MTADKRRVIGGLILLAYVSTIWAANWAVVHVPPIPVGFGQRAPAGVALAGLALTLRNVAQILVGRLPTLVALAVGVVLSYFLADPALALASAAAFGLSESGDFSLFTWLQRRRLMVAYAAAAAAGLLVDSYVFLRIATWQHAPHISMAFFPGQVLGKAYVTILALAVVAVYRRRSASVELAV
jgi:uncharacterized PurR-regulated membrane protein YhhQ (DUF165 family)